MTERISYFPHIDSRSSYDVDGKNELYKISWLKRIWIFITRQDSKRVERIQNYCDAILSKLERQVITPSDYEKVKRIYDQLKLKVSPELYALKAPNDVEENADIAEWLNLAYSWKKEQECLDRREISESDIARIKKGASFKGFNELMQDKAYRHEFFTWTLRYRLPAELFICFPGMRKKLSESFLHDELASDEGANLKVDPIARKIEILFESDTWKNLLDQNEQVSLGGIDFTMDQVLFDFAESQYSSQHLRYFPKLSHPDPNHKREGICFWEKHKVMQKIDMTKERFYEDLPPVRRLTAQEVDACFDKPLNGKWIFGIAIARDSKKLTFAGNHAFLIMGIPMKDGIYSFFPFGKLPNFYPRVRSEFIKLIFEMVDSEIIYPDDNIDRFDREHLIIPIVCDEETGMKAINKIRKDIQKSHQGLKKLLFQIGVLNCCHWVEKLAKKVFTNLPDIFGVNLFDLTPSGLSGRIFEWIRPIKWIHPYIITPFVYFMGGLKVRFIEKEDRTKSYSLWQFNSWFKEKGFYSASVLYSRREKLENDIRSFTDAVSQKPLQIWG